MAEERKNKKLSYEELERVCIDLQTKLNEVGRVNEIREMAYLCIEMLKCGEQLPADLKQKVVKFLDRLIPVPKEEGAPDKG
jgi:hypothetical protein